MYPAKSCEARRTLITSHTATLCSGRRPADMADRYTKAYNPFPLKFEARLVEVGWATVACSSKHAV